MAQDPALYRFVVFPSRKKGAHVFGQMQFVIVVFVRLHVALRQKNVFPLRLFCVQIGNVPRVLEGAVTERVEQLIARRVREPVLFVIEQAEIYEA